MVDLGFDVGEGEDFCWVQNFFKVSSKYFSSIYPFGFFTDFLKRVIKFVEIIAISFETGVVFHFITS